MSIFGDILSFPNLLSAYRKASRGKRCRAEVLSYTRNLEPNLLGLKERLSSGTWQPGRYRSFIVREPKERLIQAAPFEDRIVHHAICNIIEPLFDKGFISDSYACRSGKGTHAGMLRLKSFLRKCRRQHPESEIYALTCDVRKYFPSINHQILLSILSCKTTDSRLLELLSRIISSTPGPEGIPIGNLTSQLFANAYLNELDRFAKHSLRAKFYVRYMDDFIILSQSKEELHRFRWLIGQFLKERLGLDLHPRKANIFPARDGVDFVGYRVFCDFILLRKSGTRRFIARIKKLSRAGAPQEKLAESLKSWVAHAKWADSQRLGLRLECSLDGSRTGCLVRGACYCQFITLK